MKLPLLLAASLATVVAASPAFAAEDGAALFQSKTCWSCHGKDGKTPLMPNYPKIAGQNVKYIEEQMLDIKSGARANRDSAAMKGIMVIVNENEIKALADYVSKMKP
ncbi:MAG: c-type cytochrome [Desulfovibrionaceae bacterium]|jgi:cytochrome c|nr:c-type cytochrome [Desulfovibrionaceae bacterium]